MVVVPTREGLGVKVVVKVVVIMEAIVGGGDRGGLGFGAEGRSRGRAKSNFKQVLQIMQQRLFHHRARTAGGMLGLSRLNFSARKCILTSWGVFEY